MDDRAEKIRELARQLDAAEDERTKLTAELDERIRLLEITFNLLVGGKTSTNPGKSKRATSGDSSSEGKTHGDRVLAVLRAHPGADSATLIAQVYGEATSRNKNRFRGLMHFMKERNRVKRLPGKPARWEVIAKDTE
ncbi:MAG: hypothetical protein WC683_19505 [bacterium]